MTLRRRSSGGSRNSGIMLLPERLRLHGIGEQGFRESRAGHTRLSFFVVQCSCTSVVLVRELCRELGRATAFVRIEALAPHVHLRVALVLWYTDCRVSQTPLDPRGSRAILPTRRPASITLAILYMPGSPGNPLAHCSPCASGFFVPKRYRPKRYRYLLIGISSKYR